MTTTFDINDFMNFPIPSNDDDFTNIFTSPVSFNNDIEFQNDNEIISFDFNYVNEQMDSILDYELDVGVAVGIKNVKVSNTVNEQTEDTNCINSNLLELSNKEEINESKKEDNNNNSKNFDFVADYDNDNTLCDTNDNLIDISNEEQMILADILNTSNSSDLLGESVNEETNFNFTNEINHLISNFNANTNASNDGTKKSETEEEEEEEYEDDIDELFEEKSSIESKMSTSGKQRPMELPSNKVGSSTQINNNNKINSNINNNNNTMVSGLDGDLSNDEIELDLLSFKLDNDCKELLKSIHSNNLNKQQNTSTSFSKSVSSNSPIQHHEKLNQSINKTIKRAKRPKPQFKISTKFFFRINCYWNQISNNVKYSTLINKEAIKWGKYGINFMQPELFINNVIPALFPNNLTIEYFNKYQGIDNWIYEINKKRTNKNNLAMRWCGQELNFYDPFVIRYQINLNGKKINKQALCPYCPIEENIDLDNIFHTTQDSLYMHHVCKDHGVYSSGYELSPPFLGFENNLPIACCTECGEKCKLVGFGSGNDNCLITYFRHCFISHNKKKQKRTREQKQSDHVFFNGARKRFIYEEFDENVVIESNLDLDLSLDIDMEMIDV